MHGAGETFPHKVKNPRRVRTGFSKEGLPMTNPRDPNLPPETPEKKKRPRKKRGEAKLERLLESREAREAGTQEFAFGLRPLIMCGLPLRPVKGTYYKRRSGAYTVEVFGHPDFGIPYGQDRLLPIFLATYFVHLGCPADNTLRFPHARNILRVFGLPVDGRSYQRLKASFRRLSKTFFSIERVVVNARGRREKATDNLPLMAYSCLWYEEPEAPPKEAPREPPKKPALPSNVLPFPEPRWEGEEDPLADFFREKLVEDTNVVRLDDRWADEIRKHPIPVDLQTVRGLRDHPGALDLYQWQIWRSYAVKKTTRVPLEGAGGLVAQLGCLAGQPAKEIRRRIKEWQALIRLQWPGCPNSLSRDGNAFLIRPAKALGQLEANRFLLKLLKDPPE